MNFLKERYSIKKRVVYLSFRKFEIKSDSSIHPHPRHCEPPQEAKQSLYWPGDCFASLAMTGCGGFLWLVVAKPHSPQAGLGVSAPRAGLGVIGHLFANFLNEGYSIGMKNIGFHSLS
jgi:hypothetical protein